MKSVCLAFLDSEPAEYKEFVEYLDELGLREYHSVTIHWLVYISIVLNDADALSMALDRRYAHRVYIDEYIDTVHK